MPKPYQIVPQGSLFRPKIETHINDNSEVSTYVPTGGGDLTAVLCVFASPKGRDNKVITISNGLSQFLTEYGVGPFSVYGQPLLNAYFAARAATGAGAMVHCLRVTPADASYSSATLIAKYKIDEEDNKLHVRFVVKGADGDAYLADTHVDSELVNAGTESGETSYGLISLNDLDSAVEIDEDNPDGEGYYSVKLFTVAYRGKGVYGQNIRFRVTTDRGSDKTNDYKNYTFEIYRNETVLALAESHSVTFIDGSTDGSKSLFFDDVINDETDGSEILAAVSFPSGFETIYNYYVENIDPDTTFTMDDFDVLLGLDKYTRSGTIDGYVIDPADTVTPAAGEVPVDLGAVTGIALLGGSDGSIGADVDPATRQAALDTLYQDAFEGDIDPLIKSRFRFPTTFIFDANFNVATKAALAQLVIDRGDCVGVFDFGTGILTKDMVQAYYEANIAGLFDNYLLDVEPYCMRVVDPYGHKSVTVTSTAWMISAYLQHIGSWGGKHRPMAGNRFGVISGIIDGSVYPLFDESIDADQMDDLADLKLNIAKYNQNQQVVRSMQNTTQGKLSAMTELNNVLIVLDVKRDAERLVSNYEYDFMEPEDIARFNNDLQVITTKYQNTQVRRISGRFDHSQWEAERSILHLYIELVHKDLVKTVIIEIDVNRDSE